VIIPVRAGAAVIGAALRSVAAQTLPPAETIVVDADSADGTREVAAAFARTRVINAPSARAGEGRNIGVGAATQPFIAFLDADDVWPEARTALLLAPLQRDPGIDMATGCMVQVREDSGGTLVPFGEPRASQLPSVAVIRREAFLRVGPFADDWAVGETVEWSARAADSGIVRATIPETVLLRRIHAGNLGRTTAAPMKSYLKILHTVVQRRRESGKA
jgi:glycosyltransferase involved in cell wall biosynthesis